MSLTNTRTYSTLEVSASTMEDIINRLKAVGMLDEYFDAEEKVMRLDGVQLKAQEIRNSMVYFFGCLGRGYAGHNLYKPNGQRLIDAISADIYKTPWQNSIDGGLLTRAEVPQHLTQWYVLERREGWTAISFWDRGGDPRGNSNSAFLIKDELVSAEDLIARAKEQWPELFGIRFRTEFKAVRKEQ